MPLHSGTSQMLLFYSFIIHQLFFQLTVFENHELHTENAMCKIYYLPPGNVQKCQDFIIGLYNNSLSVWDLLHYIANNGKFCIRKDVIQDTFLVWLLWHRMWPFTLSLPLH